MCPACRGNRLSAITAAGLMLQRCTGCGLYLGVFSLDGAMPRWAALLVAPAVLTINFIERLRARSDALLIIAKPR